MVTMMIPFFNAIFQVIKLFDRDKYLNLSKSLTHLKSYVK